MNGKHSEKPGIADAGAFRKGEHQGQVEHGPIDVELDSFVRAAARRVFARTEW